MKKSLILLLPSVFMLACSQGHVETSNHTHGPKVVPAAQAQASAKTKTIKAVPLTDNFYILTGPGGNIGVSIGDDGVFVIDDKFARFGEEIIDVIKTLSDKPIRFVVNTHFHGDHTGANEILKTTGATVVAHDNVRARMGTSFQNKLFNRTIEATDPEQWPDVTFSENATFHMNGQTVRVIHTPHAHTDGDTIVYFEEANILHMGDNFFNGLFPFIDVDSGGHIQGMINAHQMALDLINDETQIIPGHGPLAVKNDLKTAQNLLIDVQSRVKREFDKGVDLEEIIAAKPLADYSQYSKFIDEEKMIRIAYASLEVKH